MLLIYIFCDNKYRYKNGIRNSKYLIVIRVFGHILYTVIITVVQKVILVTIDVVTNRYILVVTR